MYVWRLGRGSIDYLGVLISKIKDTDDFGSDIQNIRFDGKFRRATSENYEIRKSNSKGVIKKLVMHSKILTFVENYNYKFALI